MQMCNLISFLAARQNVAKRLVAVAVLSAGVAHGTVCAVPLRAAVCETLASAGDDQVPTDGIKGLEELSGLDLATVKANSVTSGTYPEDDMNKIFFLYNVKTGKFLNSGGFWGTHISLKDYPLSLWVNINSKQLVEFSQEMSTGEGHLLGWMGGTDTSQPDNGVFIDRQSGDATHYGWTFEAVNDGRNTYKIYTYATNSPSSSSTKFYLCANKGATDQDKNLGAVSQSKISELELSGYDEWRVFSMKQIFDLQDKNTDNMTSSLDLTFKLKCPGLSRGTKDIEDWTTKKFSSTGSVRYGLEHMYNTSAKVDGDTYDSGDYFSDGSTYTFDGTTFTSKQDYLRHNAKYFCMDVKNARGVIYQDVEVKHGGSYVVECKGFSTTTKAKLFAVLLDENRQKVTHTVHQTVLSQVAYMPSEEKERLHVGERNMDYAGKNFYGSRKYINTVLIQVPESDKARYIRFGVLIGKDGTDTEAGEDEWTVFDDFRLLYASKTIDEDLILDEDRKEICYLKDCSNIYKNKVLHLKKTFTKDKWNSFVLPVNLTRDQFMQAFGANARLAKLARLTDSEIEFETINMDEQQSSATVLEAYTPYIIFPTKYVAERETPAYKALLTETGGESKSHPVVVAANHIDIPNVTFATGSDNYNDLSNIDTDTWTTKKMYSVTGNGTMEAHGTFARTFGTSDTQVTDDSKVLDDTYGTFTFADRDIIPGRDDLKGSFFFSNGNVYCSTTRQRGLRGFSCWFKPTGSSLSPAMLFSIDGVAQGSTTAIGSEIAFDGNEPSGKARSGVFNLAGQRINSVGGTAGLASGVYVVNGKKCVVR